ncbi:MAG TPA: ribose-5-phosphate isomerase RpiA [Gammaproteobacteria bacterium]|nr:ribose-5-phosphate isomerase RpiA [Gammaproteobacteria bacterium]
MDQDAKKRNAALAALDLVSEGATLGIGTGSTVNMFIDALGASGRELEAAVSSSTETTRRLELAGIAVRELNDTGDLDLCIDGADEADEHLRLVKGGGGALTREKIIAAASRRFVCIVDDSKLVGVLGRFPLPVEVIPMAQAWVARQMVRAGGRPVWREGFVTDNGNHILDVHGLTIVDPVALEQRFNELPGVVTVGLFAKRPADLLLVGTSSGVRRLER